MFAIQKSKRKNKWSQFESQVTLRYFLLKTRDSPSPPSKPTLTPTQASTQAVVMGTISHSLKDTIHPSVLRMRNTLRTYGGHTLNPLDTLSQHNYGVQLGFMKYFTFIFAKWDHNKEVFGEKRKTKTFFNMKQIFSMKL